MEYSNTQRSPKWIIIESAVVIVALALFFLFVWFVNASNTKTHTNITRADYDAAHAKWRSQNIIEYKISYETEGEFADRSYMLHVRRDGNNFVIFDGDSSSNTSSEIPNPRVVEAEDDPIIEGLFTEVDWWLNVAETHTVTETWYPTLTVHFHPELGYPTDTTGNFIRTETGLPLGGHDWKMNVTEFTILERRPRIAP
jgi:hypothetical protein